MQLGDHGVRLVCAVVAAEVATGSPLEYASKQSVVERIIVKENTKDTYPAINNAVLVSTNGLLLCFSNQHYASLQRHHIGEIGRIGLNVPRNVEEELLTEGEDVTHLSVQFLIKGSA